MSAVDIPTIRRHAKHAIKERLGPGGPPPGYSIIGLAQPSPGGPVILHVNSGGNAIACEHCLRRAGYQVEHTDYDPFAAGNYGVKLLVSLKEEPAADGAA